MTVHDTDTTLSNKQFYKMSTRCFRNSEAFASELLENLGEISPLYNMHNILA